MTTGTDAPPRNRPAPSERRVAERVATDANEATASVAYRTNEVIAIYPITPASPMGEFCDAWSVEGRKNLWDDVPQVVEMQSEGGAAGAVHGALQAGSLTTTFTASQGLLLMIPNMYKLAGELTCFCMHVAARTVATHALSIFGDHSDVMAARQTGFAMLCSNSVQEAHDFALLAQAATLATRIPFMHFFDGFRTSHEIASYDTLSDDDLRAFIDETLVREHRERALTPDRPVLRGTAQNPDAFFQAREAVNSFYSACPEIVRGLFAAFAERTGRRYHLVDYAGHPEAERVVVLMGSGAETAHETVAFLAGRGEKVGVLKLRLYRPFPCKDLLAALPPTCKAIAVLDRTKEPGATGEPLYLDVVASLHDAEQRGTLPTAHRPVIVGGRYGLSSKEFTPAMVKAVLDDLQQPNPRAHFTVGIHDDVSNTSLAVDETFELVDDDVTQAVFFGLGSDGTVGANKNSIKIIADATGACVQAYFVYDSKKSGAATVSHLRFGPRPLHKPYLVRGADFLACHQVNFLERFDVLACARPGAQVLLNAPWPADEVWSHLTRDVQEEIVAKKLELHAVDAYAVARDLGLGGRINTIMQTCFFALTKIVPLPEAVAHVKEAIRKTYGKRGLETIRRNEAAVDAALGGLRKIDVPAQADSPRHRPPMVPDDAPDFVQAVTAVLLAGRGDDLPVSAFPPDGTWPVGTSRWEKRNIAQEIPIWDPDVCVQCNRCALVCPHAAIRAKAVPEHALSGAPDGFRHAACRLPGLTDLRYVLQVAPEDCTGCSLCVTVCPAKDRSNPRHKAIDMEPHDAHLPREREGFSFFTTLPELDRTKLTTVDARSSQLLQPLFEFSGACGGCGETPYIKLLTQLFGDHTIIANATGCSSIYGGNLPTTPYTTTADGRGPAWANSLFEDNAEFGLGMRVATDGRLARARRLVLALQPRLGKAFVDELLGIDQSTETGLALAREKVEELVLRLATVKEREGFELAACASDLLRKSVWIVGGDGWAYDIGYGGLDHVLGSRRDVNVLVLDTEVYSNTGGQQSKATPLGAAAKYAAAGKDVPKKDLGLEAMSYGHVFVARVALGAKGNQTVQALREAESYKGPSLVIAYSPCVAHGYDLRYGAEQQRLAVQSGAWPLYRYDPRRLASGEPPLQLDCDTPSIPLAKYMHNEGRFRMVERQDPDRFKMLAHRAERSARRRWDVYRQLAGMTVHDGAGARLARADDDATPSVPDPETDA
ncbi:MAG: pyruvate:ferredoxin (flavodoxin) oxidoreductase [Planctomycetes bacterium]|nr:pyruvate:ferredoxin (flavodoxin) oxidoreductase [Planctomycetota bacterium]